MLTSGLNYADMDLSIEDAQLWWPSGYGEQSLYEVSVNLSCGGVHYDYPAFQYGIRTVFLDTTRVDEQNRRFTLVVNGVRIFCKGANWIPADSVYARVTREKYDRLVKESRNANFNMLRVWGGGIYECDEFYEACDKYGILLWHDFMFACAAYPDHQDWFKTLVEKELDYQTKRLRNHPSIGLWCGNNENHWIFGHVAGICHEKQMGLYSSNVQARSAVHSNCPQIPFWNSSPYGGGEPNSENVGDTHYWGECMMNKEMGKRIEPAEYDRIKAKFVTEYGYPGPCSKQTMEHYFDGRSIDFQSSVWKLHTNTFEKDTVASGIEKHYLGSAESLDLDGYILYAGMVQSLMLGYSLEAIRFKEGCSGALFWMFNDTWGEVGWTIVDYDLRRKISFYGVKRAFEHEKLIIRQNGDSVCVVGCNDGAQDIDVTAEAGYLSLDGKVRRMRVVSFTVPAHSRACVYEQPMPREDYESGVFAVIPSCGCFAPAWLRICDMKNMKTPKPVLRVCNTNSDGSDLLVTVTSDTFAHGVYIDGNYSCSDNYFDLLPGQCKTLRIENGVGMQAEFHTVPIALIK